MLKFVLPGLIIAIISYLLGSISFSIIVTKKFANIDVRTVGSGNAGATNVLRAAGLKASLLVFLLDFLKCALSVFIGSLTFMIASNFFEYGDVGILRFYGAYIAGISCFTGHIYPVYFQFRGGKGVVTYAAMMAMIDWRLCVIELAVFILIVATSKMVSLGSVGTILLHPVLTFLMTYFVDYKLGILTVWGGASIEYVIASCCFAVVFAIAITSKHTANIKRILKGEESKIKFKK